MIVYGINPVLEALRARRVTALRVGDRTVARGELVDVDGAVGVRILEVER